MYNAKVGMALFIVGIAMLLFTFYLAYGLYMQAVNYKQPYQGVAAQQNSTTISGAITAGIAGAIMQLGIQSYIAIFVATIVILVLANISFKVSKLGIEMFKAIPGTDQNATTKKPKQ
ncbi:MAG: hypothetical protein ACP5RM_00525 [Candidatus Micrarchaeia archaeon]